MKMSWREKCAKIISSTRQKLVEQELSKVEGPVDREYLELEQEGPTPGSACEQHDAMVHRGLCIAANNHRARNRYCNLFPYDTNLVKLDVEPNVNSYINASWINIDGIPVKFILTMGPLHPESYSAFRPTDFGEERSPSTCEDFWRMVDQTGANMVVMLCTIQPGFQGCSQYFPADDHSPELTFGEYTVTLTGSRHTDSTVTREITLTRGASVPRTVRHVQFTKWPNYGVVENAQDLADFVEGVAGMRKDDNSPLVVHCSGGVGRSGTFATIYSFYLAMKDQGRVLEDPRHEDQGKVLEEGWWLGQDGAVSLSSCVKQLRRQRHPWMVEGLQQYLLAYATVIVLLQYEFCAATTAVGVEEEDEDEDSEHPVSSTF